MTNHLASGCCICEIRTGQEAIGYCPDLRLRRCGRCGLVYQDRAFSTVELSNIYNETYYDHWGAKQNFETLWAIKVKSCLAYLELLTPSLSVPLVSPSLLDIGCAHGFMLEAAQQRGFRPVGIEVSPAGSIAKGQGFIVYDKSLLELRLQAQSFDIVTIIDVLEHIPAPQEFMQEIRRILKPGGAVLIVTPDIGSWAAKIMKGKWPHLKLEHVTYFNRRALSMLLTKMEFRVMRIRPSYKYLNFDYILGTFQKYTPGIFSRFLQITKRWIPERLAKTSIRFQTEMLAIARRTDAC